MFMAASDKPQVISKAMILFLGEKHIVSILRGMSKFILLKLFIKLIGRIQLVSINSIHQKLV